MSQRRLAGLLVAGLTCAAGAYVLLRGICDFVEYTSAQSEQKQRRQPVPAYRDPQVALPDLVSGSDCWLDPSLMRVVNVRKDGTWSIRPGQESATAGDVLALISEGDRAATARDEADAVASLSVACAWLVLRCDRDAKWEFVAPLIGLAQRSRVEPVFAVSNERVARVSGRIIDRGERVPQDPIWVRLTCPSGNQEGATPQVIVGDLCLKDWSDVNQKLARLGEYHGGFRGTKLRDVVVMVEPGTRYGCVIQLLDAFSQLEPRGVWIWEKGRVEALDALAFNEPSELPVADEDVPNLMLAEPDDAHTMPPLDGPVEKGLVWLASAQERGGRWSSARWGGQDVSDLRATGLSLLAFLRAGRTRVSGRFSLAVLKGLEWLRKSQEEDGRFGWRTFDEQAIATLAICEAYALTHAPALGRMAQRAVDYIVKMQPEHGGFGSGGAAAKDEGDMLVTGWAILAINSAMLAELKVPVEAAARGREFLANASRLDGASARLVGSKEHEPLATAVGLCCRQLLGETNSESEFRAAATFLRRHSQDKGRVGQGQGRLVGDLDFTWFSAVGMCRMGGKWWPEWNKAFRGPLVGCQAQERLDGQGGFIQGSWDPARHFLGDRHGRVCTTAMALLSLEAGLRPPARPRPEEPDNSVPPGIAPLK